MRVALLLLSTLQLLANEPSWLIDPSQGGKYRGAIGCTQEIGDRQKQERIALLQAKGALSQQINTDVEDSLEMESNVLDDDLEESVEYQSTQKSNTSLQIEYMEKYIYKNGMMCVWVIQK